ncbi:ribonuclease HI family protein [Patescibacteria group bacterium]|nr:ribonuclease HI family protein [Patescibacteria group bacterium]
MAEVTIFTDGGSRGNPGPAGSGAVIYKDDVEIAHVSKYLGIQTNNFAEYEALILALQTTHKVLGSPVTAPVTIKMDSELIVKQMKGEYKVKHPVLKEKHQEVRLLIMESFPNIKFQHVPREENKVADQYANDAMDRGS